MVSRKQYITIRLKQVVSYEIYKNLNLYIEKWKKILEELVKFYVEMDFIGYRTKDSITNEITNIITLLAKFLKYKGDNVIKICSDSDDKNVIWLLLVYLFPYIILVIKLKIEKGIYKRINYVVLTSQVRILTQLERRVERDINGNIKETFRFRQNVSQESLVRLIK